MELSKSYDHPSLLLINEIEILFTQVRLMELYVKQAQTTATHDGERIRQHFQAELNALHDELKQKDLSLETQKALSRQTDQSLREEVDELRHQLLASQHLLAARKTELDLARSDADGFRQRIAQLESSIQKAQLSSASEIARNREALDAELAALTTKLERKESALETLSASVKEVESQLRAQIRDLHSQLAAKTELLENRTTELESAQSEAVALRQSIEALELRVAQTEAAANAATEARETLQNEIAAQQTTLEQRDLSLQQSHAATRDLENRLNGQLDELHNQLAEKQGLLEARNQEIIQLAARTNDLQGQLGEQQRLLEARSQETSELTARVNDLLEQITCLELTNKQTVKEARAAAKTLEDTLHARVQELEAVISEKSQLLQNRNAELETSQSETNALRQRIEQLELTVTQAQVAARAATEARETLQNELAALQTSLEQNNLSLQQSYAATRDLEHRLNGQLGELQNQLAEKQGFLEDHRQEIGQLTARTNHLQDQLAEKQVVLDARSQEISQLTATTNDLQGELAEKQGLLEARSQEITQLTARTNDLQEEIARLQKANRQTVEETQAAARALEDSLNTRLRELEANLSEKSQLLHNRTAELENTQSETTALRQRIQQLELTAAQIEAAKHDADRMRAALENELNNAHSELEQKDASFAQRDAEFRESTERLNTQLQVLQTKLADTQQLLEAKDENLGQALQQIAGLEARIAGLASLHHEAQVAATTEVERVRQQSQFELETLRTELRDRQQALEDQQAAAGEFEASLKREIQDLINQLAEKQAWVERREQEFEQLGSEAAFLRERIAQLESAANEAGRSSGAEAERIRGEFQAELAALQGQLQERELGLVESQTFMRESESRWQSQIHDLQIQVTEKHLLLEARNVEIIGLQRRLSAISDQLATVESASQEAVATAAKNAELDRQQFAAELSSRQEELSNMERLLADHETQSHDLQHSFNTRLAGLQDQLAEKQVVLDARSQEITQLTATTNDLQGELAEKQGLLEARSQEITQLTARTNDLQEEIARLQKANRQTVEETQAAARALEDSLNTRLRELEANRIGKIPTVAQPYRRA